MHITTTSVTNVSICGGDIPMGKLTSALSEILVSLGIMRGPSNCPLKLPKKGAIGPSGFRRVAT